MSKKMTTYVLDFESFFLSQMSGRHSSNEQLSMNDRSLPVDACETKEEDQEQRDERSASNPGMLQM